FEATLVGLGHVPSSAAHGTNTRWAMAAHRSCSPWRLRRSRELPRPLGEVASSGTAREEDATSVPRRSARILDGDHLHRRASAGEEERWSTSTWLGSASASGGGGA